MGRQVMRGHRTSGERKPPGAFFAHTSCKEEPNAIRTGVLLHKGFVEEGWLIERDDCWIWRFH